MAIKLEVGKRYELNNGEVHECTKMNGDDPLAVDYSGYGPFVINGCLYHQDGTFAGRASIQEYHGVKRCVDDVQPDTTDDATKLWRDMTPEEKGALLLAHHEGKTIEWFDRGRWITDIKFNPQKYTTLSYRVKTEPVRETMTLYGSDNSAWLPLPLGLDTHRITFDVIDGVPDCVSVKMEEL